MHAKSLGTKLYLNFAISNFHQLEAVGRGSETQLLVGKKLNYLI